MKIAIACDHAGYHYKELIKSSLVQNTTHQIKDFGTYSGDSVDYPDFVHPLARAVTNQEANYGILICGTANGVAITANKYQAVRAGICWDVPLAKLTRQHNNANVLCIPARFVSIKLALAMVETFLHTEFEGGRHARRVAKIASFC